MKFLIPAFVCLFLMACATEKVSKQAVVPTIPQWITELPVEKDRIFAVGYCGPTFRPEDGKGYAAENARAELAKSLEVKVQSVLYVEEHSDGRGGYTDGATVTSVGHWAVDAALNGSKIIAYWRDDSGSYSGGSKGSTYALASMPADSDAIRKLAQNLKKTKVKKEQNKNDVENVRENADKAFNELEHEHGGD